jgi:hypothetical protein
MQARTLSNLLDGEGEVKAIVDRRRGFCHFRSYQMEYLQVVWCAVHTAYHTRAAPTRIALAISSLPHPHNFVCTRTVGKLLMSVPWRAADRSPLI